MKRWHALAMALTLVLTCLGPAQAEIAPSRVRMVQTIASTPGVDVLLNNNQMFCSLPFRAVTRYVAVAAGTYNVQAVPGVGPSLASALLEAEPNAPYSVVLVGTPGAAEVLILIDDLSRPPRGMARVRFVNAVPGAPAVDVAVKGGPVLFRDVGYRGVGNYVMIAAGTYDVQVRLAASGELVAELPGVQALEGVVCTVYAVGTPGGEPPVQALIAVESVGGLPVPIEP